MNQLNEDYITINDTNYNLQALNPWPGKVSQRIRQEKNGFRTMCVGTIDEKTLPHCEL
jgi:hypothetical protein